MTIAKTVAAAIGSIAAAVSGAIVTVDGVWCVPTGAD